MAISSRDVHAIEAAKLYYGEGLPQAQIAEMLQISRPTVSKLLQYARDAGFVSISIRDPREESEELTRLLCGRYGLLEVSLAAPPIDDQTCVVRYLGVRGAEVISRLVEDGDLVGVSWGRTIHSVSRNLARHPRRGVEVIQLKGGLSYSAKETNDVEIIQNFCKAFDAYGRFLPLPVIFESVDVKDIVEHERHIQQCLQLGASCRTAVFTIGGMGPDSLLFNLGYLSADEISRVRERAVGDICSRFITADGVIACPDVDARTVGIQLEALKGISQRVMVAGGQAKTEAIAAGLRAGFATHLVTDHFTAHRLLDLEQM